MSKVIRPLPRKVTKPTQQVISSTTAREIAETLPFLVKDGSWQEQHIAPHEHAYTVKLNCPALKRKQYTIHERRDAYGQLTFEGEDASLSLKQYVDPEDFRKTLAIHAKHKNVTYYRQQRFDRKGSSLVTVYFDSKYQIEYWQEKIKGRDKWVVENPKGFSKTYFTSHQDALDHMKTLARLRRNKEEKSKGAEVHLFSPPEVREAYWEILLAPEKKSFWRTFLMSYLYFYGLNMFFESGSSKINENATTETSAPSVQDCEVSSQQTLIPSSCESQPNCQNMNSLNLDNKCGDNLYTTRSAEKNFNLLLRKAEATKDPKAQIEVAYRYFFGQGVPVNYKKALQWNQKAAEQGEILAQYNLGMQYYQAQGVTQDFQEAVKWITLAANQDFPEAQIQMGFFYYFGNGVPQSYRKAMEWWEKAAEKNDAFALFNIGGLYHDGRGVPQDYRKAVSYFKKAAIQGLAEAQTYLASSYFEGCFPRLWYGQGVVP